MASDNSLFQGQNLDPTSTLGKIDPLEYKSEVECENNRSIGAHEDYTHNDKPPTQNIDEKPSLQPTDSAHGQNSRPTSAASMRLSFEESVANKSNIDLTKTLQEVKHITDEKYSQQEEPVKECLSKKCLIISLIITGVIIALAILIAVLLLLFVPNTPSTTQSPFTATSFPSTAYQQTENPLTVPPVVIITQTDNFTYGGTWMEWAEWNLCSRSCDVGFQARNRTCLTTDLLCQGVSTQERRCNTALCPQEEPVSVWESWNPWQTCSTSCDTGLQQRQRVCISLNETNTSAASCSGVSLQSRSCNEYPCPDCRMSCENGALTRDCKYCQCSNIASGQVLSDALLPLSNVTIHPSTAPYVELTRTNESGNFILNDACLTETYTFKKTGYVDKFVDFQTERANVTMRNIVPLQMGTNPRDAMGIVGQSMQICCSAYGIPGPDYYEWIKDGEVLTTEWTQSSSALTLNDLSQEDTGYYTCRASNDYGAIFSSSSTLLVKESADDFCSSYPQTHLVNLPSDCLFENSSVIDTGVCESNLCYGGNNQGCNPDIRHCCGPTELVQLEVNCLTYTLQVYRVNACGCTVCQTERLTIYGFAGDMNGEPLRFGYIYWNGSLVTNTSIDGTFSFTVENTISRASVLFVDIFNRTFMDSTYVFEMPNNDVDSHFIRVTLPKRGVAKILNSSLESVIEMNATQINIPPESFYTSNGDQYHGVVTATIASINTSDLNELASAPGDLSIIDNEGDTQQLLSYEIFCYGSRMFGMFFEDEDGNRLSIPGEISVTLTTSSFDNENITSPVRVWTLNPNTGLWVFAADLEEESDTRRKRQIRQGGGGQRTYRARIRGISIDVQWYNFDSISTQTCVLKARLFENDRYYEDDQLHAGQVTIVLQDSNGYSSMSRNRVSTDSRNNGFCMVLPCQSSRSRNVASFRGYVFADFGTTDLNPAQNSMALGLENSMFDLVDELNYDVIDNKIQVDFNERLVNREGLGPYYDWDRKWRYSSACSNAQFDKNHFRFSKLSSCLVRSDNYDIIPFNPIHEALEHLLLWYDINSYFDYHQGISPPLRSLWAFKSCFIKVLAPRNTVIRAISYVADPRHYYYDQGQIYGVREDCALDGAVCLQIRPPGSPRTAAFQNDNNALDDEDRTLISLQSPVADLVVLNVSVNIMSITEIWNDVITNISAHETEYQMHISSRSSYGSRYGIYCYEGQTREIAEQALYMCRNGYGSVTPRRDTSLENWAVTFGQHPRGGPSIAADILILDDVSGSMNSVRNIKLAFLDELLSSIVIGEDSIKIAYHQVYGRRGWPLSSSLASTQFASGQELISSAPDDGVNYSFGTFMFDQALASLIIPGDRADAPNFVIVIWDGDFAPDTSNLAASARIISLARWEHARTRAIVASDEDHLLLGTATAQDLLDIIEF